MMRLGGVFGVLLLDSPPAAEFREEEDELA